MHLLNPLQQNWNHFNLKPTDSNFSAPAVTSRILLQWKSCAWIQKMHSINHRVTRCYSCKKNHPVSIHANMHTNAPTDSEMGEGKALAPPTWDNDCLTCTQHTSSSLFHKNHKIICRIQKSSIHFQRLHQEGIIKVHLGKIILITLII